MSYDKYLKSGPYYFGYLTTKPDYVDHYAYQRGLLISYWTRRRSTTTSACIRVRGSTFTWTPA